MDTQAIKFFCNIGALGQQRDLLLQPAGFEVNL